MKKIIIGITVLVGVGIILFLVMKSQKTEVPITNDNTSVIEGGASFSETPFEEEVEVLVAPEVQKKIDQAVTTAQLLSQGIYQIDRYPVSDAPSFVPEYSITYFEQEKRFNVTLFEYPLLQTRVKASEAFLQKLSLTEEEACKLNVNVGVTPSVNVGLAGQNLGLSFCPNRVDLSSVVDDRVSNEEQQGE